jgi:hypothetical protein
MNHVRNLVQPPLYQKAKQTEILTGSKLVHKRDVHLAAELVQLEAHTIGPVTCAEGKLWAFAELTAGVVEGVEVNNHIGKHGDFCSPINVHNNFEAYVIPLACYC